MWLNPSEIICMVQEKYNIFYLSTLNCRMGFPTDLKLLSSCCCQRDNDSATLTEQSRWLAAAHCSSGITWNISWILSIWSCVNTPWMVFFSVWWMWCGLQPCREDTENGGELRTFLLWLCFSFSVSCWASCCFSWIWPSLTGTERNLRGFSSHPEVVGWRTAGTTQESRK